MPSLFGGGCIDIDGSVAGVVARPFDHGMDENTADCFAMDKKAGQGIAKEAVLHWNTWNTLCAEQYSNVKAREAIFSEAGNHLYFYFARFFEDLGQSRTLQIYEALTRGHVTRQGDVPAKAVLETMKERSSTFEAEGKNTLELFMAKKLFEIMPQVLSQVDITLKLEYGNLHLVPDISRQIVYTAVCLQYRAIIEYRSTGDSHMRIVDVVCGVYIGEAEAVGPLPKAGTIYSLSCTCGGPMLDPASRGTTVSNPDRHTDITWVDGDQATLDEFTPGTSRTVSDCGDGPD
jgi:hypothetical protein